LTQTKTPHLFFPHQTTYIAHQSLRSQFERKTIFIMENNAKRVFLTGASGFIASHILSLLIEVGPSTEAHTSRTN
jgi:hypothetical protein